MTGTIRQQPSGFEMVETTKRLRRLSLICGIISSILYFCTDMLGGLLWDNYDFTSQYISELSAIGAPSRAFVISLYSVYNALVAGFALGVWESAGEKRALRITGCLLIGYVVAGLVGLLFPMNPDEPTTALTNTMHQIIAGVTVLVILLSLGFAATAFGKQFRFYSLGTILVYLLLGALPFLGVAQVEAGEATPWVGLVERIMVYGYMLWVAVLTIALLRKDKRPSLTREAGLRHRANSNMDETETE
ncbi:MAG: DUF998 domain-containing protein [Promethearchaeota archaeon]